LRKNDLEYIVRHIPKDVKTLLIHNPGTFIGGGFIRAIIAGEKVSDIDLFGGSKWWLNRWADMLAEDRGVKPHKSGNAITILAPPRWPVQFITRWLFDKPEELIESFDFTICKSVIWADVEIHSVLNKDVQCTGRIKRLVTWKSICHDDFYSDLAARRIVYTFPNRNEDAGGSFMRVKKFVARGYNVQTATLAGVVARLCLGIEQIKKAVPGSSVNEAEQWLAKLVQSKLLEVDPLTIHDGMSLMNEHEPINEEVLL
jgi:hypothetical protein